MVMATKQMNGSANGATKQFEKKNEMKDIDVLARLESIQLIRRCVLWFTTSMAVYLFWIFNISIAPVLLLLLLVAIYHEIKKYNEKRHNRVQSNAIIDDKTLVQNTFKSDNVPPWILFPDKERVEWINTILEMLWPNLGLRVREVIYGVIEPDIQKSLEEYGMSGFSFEKVSLGQIPPRITGIKVYDKKSTRNQIIIDVDLLYTSDCDVTISLKGWSSGLQGIRFRGTLRIELKSLINEAPFFESVEAYFLTTPEFDFSLGGIANIFDVTGVSGLLRTVLMEILANYMVFPNTLKLIEKEVGIHKHRIMETIHTQKAIQKVSHPSKNVIRVTYGNR